MVESVSGSMYGSGSSGMQVSDCVQNTVLDYKYEYKNDLRITVRI